MGTALLVKTIIASTALALLPAVAFADTKIAAVFDLTGGLMSTASGLLFTGDNDGYFYAFESATGKQLWRFQTGAPVWGSAPITYMLDGRQWVLTTAGLTFTAFALPAAPGGVQ